MIPPANKMQAKPAGKENGAHHRSDTGQFCIDHKYRPFGCGHGHANQAELAGTSRITAQLHPGKRLCDPSFCSPARRWQTGCLSILNGRQPAPSPLPSPRQHSVTPLLYPTTCPYRLRDIFLLYPTTYSCSTLEHEPALLYAMSLSPL